MCLILCKIVAFVWFHRTVLKLMVHMHVHILEYSLFVMTIVKSWSVLPVKGLITGIYVSIM